MPGGGARSVVSTSISCHALGSWRKQRLNGTCFVCFMYVVVCILMCLRVFLCSHREQNRLRLAAASDSPSSGDSEEEEDTKSKSKSNSTLKSKSRSRYVFCVFYVRCCVYIVYIYIGVFTCVCVLTQGKKTTPLAILKR
jgi:hypothetical protein